MKPKKLQNTKVVPSRCEAGTRSSLFGSLKRGSYSSATAVMNQAQAAGEACSKSFAYVCSGCNKPIRRDKFLLKACDKYWHENCLKCDRCHSRLGELGSTLYCKSDMNLCRRDYLEMFGKTGICSVCEKLICASEMVMRAKQNVYHLECFACQLCNQRFCVGDRFYLCENKVVCQYDYEEHILPIQRSLLEQTSAASETAASSQPTGSIASQSADSRINTYYINKDTATAATVDEEEEEEGNSDESETQRSTAAIEGPVRQQSRCATDAGEDENGLQEPVNNNNNNKAGEDGDGAKNGASEDVEVLEGEKEEKRQLVELQDVAKFKDAEDDGFVA